MDNSEKSWYALLSLSSNEFPLFFIKWNRQHSSYSFFYKLKTNLRDNGSFSEKIINQQPRTANIIGEDIHIHILEYVRAKCKP